MLYRVVGALAFVLGVFLFGYYKGHSAVQEQFDAYKLQEQVVIQSTAKVQAQVNKESANVYKAKGIALNNYYGGMHYNGANQVSYATTGINGNPAYSILIGQCAQTTLQLVSLQQWIKDQSDATEVR